MKVGIITISDRASAGEYQDEGGPALKKACADRAWEVAVEALVPDDLERIQTTVLSCSSQGCGLILTTGGTGITERDVTPEAIRGIMRVEIPGFGETMRMRSLEITPNAVLSRCLAAVVDESVVIALPGKPRAAVECLDFIAGAVEGAVEHAVKLVSKQATSC